MTSQLVGTLPALGTAEHSEGQEEQGGLRKAPAPCADILERLP